MWLFKYFPFTFLTLTILAQHPPNDQAMMTHFNGAFMLIHSAVIVDENLPVRIVNLGNGSDANVNIIESGHGLIGDPIVIDVSPPYILERFVSTHRVWLFDVGMRRISMESFRTCTNLRYLAFPNNLIEEVPENVFKNCENLNSLHLNSNRIEKIYPKSFVGLSNLTTLLMNFNRLTTVNADFFTHLTSLRDISFFLNPITEVSAGALPASLHYINLVDCKISQIHPDTFRNLTQLRTLRLARNAISELPRGIFSDLISLELLDMHTTNIRRLNSNSFGYHPKMRWFGIAQSSLDELQHNFFENFPTLDEFNALRNLCANVFLTNTSSIDFTEDTRLHQCFANWFVPQPENDVQVESED